MEADRRILTLRVDHEIGALQNGRLLKLALVRRNEAGHHDRQAFLQATALEDEIMATFDERTHQIFALLDIPPATKAASGRYLRSATFRPGIRYWAGNAHRKDLFGVQFFGEGLEDAGQYRQALANAGFASRTPQPSQLTFCREIDFLTDGGTDMTAIAAAKAALDKIVR